MRNLLLIVCICVFITNCDSSSSIQGVWKEVYDPNSYVNYSIIFEFASDGTYKIDKYKIVGKYDIKDNDIYITNKNGKTFKLFEIKGLKKDTLVLSRHYTDTVIHNAITVYKYKYRPYKFDPIIYDLAKKYNFFNPDTLGDGTLFFQFYDIELKDENKVKGIIDRAIGSLPKREKIHKYSRFEGKLFNYYEWETLDYLLKSEMYFDSDKDKIDLKLWASEK